jgi:hypothetical protein
MDGRKYCQTLPISLDSKFSSFQLTIAKIITHLDAKNILKMVKKTRLKPNQTIIFFDRYFCFGCKIAPCFGWKIDSKLDKVLVGYFNKFLTHPLVFLFLSKVPRIMEQRKYNFSKRYLKVV